MPIRQMLGYPAIYVSPMNMELSEHQKSAFELNKKRGAPRREICSMQLA